MHKSKYNKIYTIVIITLILTISFSPQMQSFFKIPSSHKISVGDQLNIPLAFPDRIINTLKMQFRNEEGLIETIDFTSGVSKKFINSGSYIAKLSILGIVPIKEIQVDVVPQVKVYPSGHSIGVILKAQGVMVIGYSKITTKENIELEPAKEQGIQIGDIIVKVNNQPLDNDHELAKMIDKYGNKEEKIRLEIIRGGLKKVINIKPVKCKETGRYQLGLYVRDTAAGIGTLTFFEPDKGRYGALGHLIANANINESLEDGMGRIISASIQKINHGRKGFPGEKVGSFSNNKLLSGVIMKNCQLGIYGVLDEKPHSVYYPDPIPVAYSHQIETGTAHILTVLENDKVEKFEIDIERVITHQRYDGKGLVIKITDPKLIEKTGGIVQGMSGSPIIQNNKLVGAVTHVFVQDPTRGYGILAEWMIEEIGIIPKDISVKSALSPHHRIEKYLQNIPTYSIYCMFF